MDATAAIDKEIEEASSSRHWYYYLGQTLIKALKPCYDGDRIHLKDREGVFTVLYASARGLRICTKDEEFFTRWDNFKCLVGKLRHGKSEAAKLRMVKRQLQALLDSL